MNDTQRIIGELKEFKRATLEELEELNVKVDALNAFRWKAAGIMTAVVFVMEVIGQLARASEGDPMEETLLNILVQSVPVVGGVLSALGLVLVVAVVVIRLTPTKKDDAVLEQVRAIPILGGLIAALIKRAPLKEPEAK